MSIKTNKINNYMTNIKLLLGTIAISSALGGIILLWNEDAVSCGVTMCKVLETMFFLVSLISAREISKLNKK